MNNHVSLKGVVSRPRSARRSEASSALVLTLLGVVLLTIVVVAFMQVMTQALSSANGYANIERATLASRAGLEAAIAHCSRPPVPTSLS